MVRNYLITALRNFYRAKSYTLLNVLGLSVGVTTCILIFLIISYEVDFDTFHSKYNQIYRVVRESTNSSGTDHSALTPYPFANAFRGDFDDVPLMTQLHFEGETLLSIDQDKRIVHDVIFADSLFFDVFDFEVISGNPRVELGQPGKMFLTESLAAKLGTIDPGQKIVLGNSIELAFAGIIKDPPVTSHIRFSMVVSMPSFNSDFLGLPIDEWGMTISGFSYLVLPNAMPVESIESRLGEFITKIIPDDAANLVYHLQPLENIHFDAQFYSSLGPSNVNVKNLYILGLIGIFILLVACVNFVNLATALAIRKSKEIGIRKTLGANRSQLVSYFLGETFLLILFTLLISLGLVEWLLPWLNNFLGKSIELSLFTNPRVMVFLLVLTIVTTLLSGFYPALMLSGFSPNEVLKNKISGHTGSGAFLRKALVVFQFFIAQALIIGTLVVARQMDFIKNKSLGFDKEFIFDVQMPDRDIQKMSVFTNRLTENSNILNVSLSVGPPSTENDIGTSFFMTERGEEEEYDVSLKIADRQYKDTYGLKMIAGDWISESQEKMTSMEIPEEDRAYVYVVNQAAVRQLGFSDEQEILGKHLTIGLNGIDAPVIGVVEDFHLSSLRDKIEPVVIINYPYFYYYTGIRLQPGNVKETLSFIEKTWKELYPEYYYQASFLDDDLEALYTEEDKMFTMFTIFSGISIFIGCLGLYGLVSFMTTQRLKEIGVRKVLGASVSNITMLFSKDFLILVMIAFIVAGPFTWYAMDQWLQSFAFRVPIGVNVFVIGILISLVLTFITVSYRSIKAALVNPATIIRNE